MHVLYATAELAPLVKVGGLGEASCGLLRALHAAGHRVDIVLPDYGPAAAPYPAAETRPLALPAWASPATVGSFELDGVGTVHRVAVPGMARHHPYVHQATGEGWADNDRRFFAFSAAVAALAEAMRPDVVHLNDWHTATAAAWLDAAVPTVFTVHNLSYQGWAEAGWLDALGPRAAAFAHRDATNPMAGAVRLADRVVAVSPTYAAEICRPATGEGLDELLAARGDRLYGIRNGIDTARWDPALDEWLPATYHAGDLSGREICTKELRRISGFDTGDDPIIAVVARMVAQKGVDVAVDLAPLLATMPARLVLVGDGDPGLMAQARVAAAHFPERVWYAPYRDELAHLVAAGADLMLVPSRFEPCGLTQMEAMAYGAVPVVNGVGGLRDTVVDADRHPGTGTGFVADTPGPSHLVDAVHRALRARQDRSRFAAIQQRAMRADWSWRGPAAAYAALYSAVVAEAGA